MNGGEVTCLVIFVSRSELRSRGVIRHHHRSRYDATGVGDQPVMPPTFASDGLRSYTARVDTLVFAVLQKCRPAAGRKLIRRYDFSCMEPISVSRIQMLCAWITDALIYPLLIFVQKPWRRCSNDAGFTKKFAMP